MGNKEIDKYLEEFPEDTRPALKATMSAFSELSEIPPAADVSENFFVTKMLPILTSKEEDQDLSIWMDVAGHAMRSINIIDDTTGEVRFKAPALLTTMDKQIIGGSGRNSTFEVIATTQLKESVLPGMGGRYFQRHIVDKIDRDDNVNSDNAKVWKKILDYYGYGVKSESVGEVSDDVQLSAKSIEEEIEVTGYDDL